MNAKAKHKPFVPKGTDQWYKEARIPWLICQAQRRVGFMIAERSFPFFAPDKDMALKDLRELNIATGQDKYTHLVIFGELIEARDKATTKVYAKKEELIEI